MGVARSVYHRLMAATASSVAATAVLTPRLPSRTARSFSSAFPYLPPRLSSLKLSSEPGRFALLQVKASSSEDTSLDAGELFSDLKEKWDGVENKSTVLVYGGGAIVAVWLSSVVVGGINSVPLLPKIMELIGLGYTGWFVYRYLLFKSSRKELASDIEAIKKKISGTE